MALVFVGQEHSTLQQYKDLPVFYSKDGLSKGGYFHAGETELLYCSNIPVVKTNGTYAPYVFSASNSLETILRDSHNNFCGLRVFVREGIPHLSISSSRFARARLFFYRGADGFYFSNDPREIIPYTEKRVNPAGVYSVIKFGTTPEYLSCIHGVYAVPASSFLTIGIPDLLARQGLGIHEFEKYYTLPYTLEGGNINATETLLGEIFDHVAKQPFAVPVSGGIDSSLMNYMVDERTDSPYPAYYVAFGKDDTEIPFAREAVKKTKAELDICIMEAKDFIPAFHFQARHLSQPVGESSAIAMAHLFANHGYGSVNILDGTLADGCYGSKNYTKPLFSDIKEKSALQLRFNEFLAGFLQLNDLPGKNRFSPRDSMIDDAYLRFMNVYVGPLGNTAFKKAKSLNREIFPYWEWYYGMIRTTASVPVDDWMKYSIFKMMNYAANTTIAKTYDLCGATDRMVYPFMWKEILDDQGKYTWSEKTQNNIIKYPLKKIIEKYADRDFIYRKKVGLNSSMSAWLSLPENKAFITDTVKNSTLAQSMLGKPKMERLIKTFKGGHHHPNISNLMISLASCEAWKNANGLTV